MAIKYEAYTREGERVKGVLATDSEDDAYTLLEQDELIPYRLRPLKERRSVVQLLPGLFQPKPQDVIDFARSMASLLDSGIPLRRALIVQRDEAHNPGLKEALRQMVIAIESGQRMSEAIAHHPTVFPDFFVRLVRVGEAAGNLAMALKQVSDTLARRKAVQDKVRSALAYPAVSLVVAIVAAVVLIKFSLPALTEILTEFGGELPIATRTLISISDFIETYTLVLVGIFVGGITSVIVGFKTRQGIIFKDHLMLRLPMVKGIVMGSNIFYLSSNLSTLMKSGVPSIEAMRMAGDGMNNVVLRDRLKVVTRNATEGMRLGQAFADNKGFPNLLSLAVTTGELQGNVADTLAGLAEYYEETTDRAVSGATEFIQPAVILMVAGVVGFIAIAIISGIYSSIGSVG